jgi:hypothetical protein
MLNILANRFVAYSNPDVSKSFAANWWALVRIAWQLTPSELKINMGLAGSFWVKLIWMFVAVSLVSLALRFAQTPERKTAAQHVGLIVLGAIAIMLTTVIYALASYRITPVAFMGRSLTTVSWALSVVFFALISTTVLRQPRVLRVTAVTIGTLIIVVNYMALCTHLHELAFVWSEEKEVLDHVPTDQFQILPPNSRVLYLGPAYFHDWVIFGADHELTGAVLSLPPFSEKRRAFEGWLPISPATMQYNWTWNGETLLQDCPGYFTKPFAAKHLFIWNYGDVRLREAQKGFRRKFGADSVSSGPPPAGSSAGVGSVTHTNLDANAWWQVDLGASAKINSIKIWNRTDGSVDRLSDYWVFLSNEPFGPAETPATLQSRLATWHSHQSTFPNPSSTIPVGGAEGRYVRVQLGGSNYLSLGEVQVFGARVNASSSGSNLALGKVATQSSTLAGYPRAGAAAAVDGNTDGNFIVFSSPAAPAASFVEADTKTMGAWKGVYGTDGFILAADSANYPGYVQVDFAGHGLSTWAPTTRNVRALEASDGMGRIASAWSSPSNLTIDIGLMDAKTHRISLYFLDWDEAGRTQVIDVLNASNGKVLESHAISDFANGQYLTFDLSGQVKIRVTPIAGSSAVLSGLFFQ